MKGMITWTLRRDLDGQVVFDETTPILDESDIGTLGKGMVINGQRHTLSIGFDPPVAWAPVVASDPEDIPNEKDGDA